MAFAGEQPERWLVRLMVTRDPTTEGVPHEWDWGVLLDGGDPVVVSADLVGYETEEPCSPAPSPSESS